MLMVLNQSEIELAIIQYFLGKISENDSQRIEIELAATQGTDRFKATINVTDKVVEVTPNAP